MSISQPDEGTSDSPAQNEEVTFDSSRAADLSYQMNFFERLSLRRHANPLRTMLVDGQSVYGVVDLMDCVGDYKDRKSAKDTWGRLRGEVDADYSLFKGPNRVDFCTISDFLDHILPHVGGKVAKTIRLARSRTATAVATGSTLAIAMTQSNAEAIADAPEPIRQTVDAVRTDVERKLIQESGCASEPSTPVIQLADIKVICNGLPSGTGCYHRVSLKKYVPGFHPPAHSKMQAHIGKLGMTDSVSRRHTDYGADGGVFETVIIPKAGYRAARNVERIQKAMIDPFREYSKWEYYNLDAYREELILDDGEEPYAHMLPLIARYVERVLVVKEVTVEDTWDVTQTSLDTFLSTSNRTARRSANRYLVNVTYDELPDWQETASNPIIVRESVIEVERARLRVAEENRKLEEAKLRAVEEHRRTAEENRKAEEAKLLAAEENRRAAEEVRKVEETKLRVAENSRKEQEIKRQTTETTLRVAAEYRKAEEAKAVAPVTPGPVIVEPADKQQPTSEETLVVRKACMSFESGFNEFVKTFLLRSEGDAVSVGSVLNLLFTLSGGTNVDPSKLEPLLGSIGYDYDMHLGGEYAVFWNWTMRPVVIDPVLSSDARTFIRDRNLRIGLNAWIPDEWLMEEATSWGNIPSDTLMQELREAFTPCGRQTSGILGLMCPSRLINGNLSPVAPGGQKLFVRCVKTGRLVHVYSNQSAASLALRIPQGTLTTKKQSGRAHDDKWLLQGVDSLSEWEKSMILTMAPASPDQISDEMEGDLPIATVRRLDAAPTDPDAIAWEDLINKGENVSEDVERFVDDCFVRDASASVFTTQITAVYKAWAPQSPHSKSILAKVKKMMPDQGKEDFGATMGQKKLAVRGLRLRTIYYLAGSEVDFEQFVAERLFVDCIARIHKSVLLAEFTAWHTEVHNKAPTKAVARDFLRFCHERFSFNAGVFDGKVQKPGYLFIGLKSTAAALIGTHSKNATRPGVTFRSIVTKATIHFPDEREASVRFNLRPEGIAKLRAEGGLILNRYEEVKPAVAVVEDKSRD